MDQQPIIPEDYPAIIKRILTEYAEIRISNGDIEQELIFDDEGKHYQLLEIGWLKYKRVFNSSIHIDIRGDKVWVQRDSTEDGVTHELVTAGIPKDQIVLGFHAPSLRKYTGYAVK
jgi:hypothetical protein